MKRDPVRAAVLRERRLVRDVLGSRAAWHEAQSQTAVVFLRDAHREAARVLDQALSELNETWRAADRKIWDDGKPVDCPGGHGAQCCGEPEACRAALDKGAKRKRGKA